MNRNTALDRIRVLAAADYDPELNTIELESLLELYAQTEDEDGLPPSDEDWTPTYSRIGLNRAVKAAFEVKAAKASGRFDFVTDGQTFNRSQVFKMLSMMADSKRSGIHGSTTTG